ACNDADKVARPGPPVSTSETHEATRLVSLRRAQGRTRRHHWQAAGLEGQIVRMDMLARPDVPRGAADGLRIFHYRLAGCNGPNGHLVPRLDGLRNRCTIVQRRSRLQPAIGNDNIVRRGPEYASCNLPNMPSGLPRRRRLPPVWQALLSGMSFIGKRAFCVNCFGARVRILGVKRLNTAILAVGSPVA